MKREMVRNQSERERKGLEFNKRDKRECYKNWATEEGREYIKDKLEWERCRKITESEQEIFIRN